MTAAARFTQSDITRAIKGARAAGVHEGRIELDRDGKIVIIFGPDANRPAPANEWDEVLPDAAP